MSQARNVHDQAIAAFESGDKDRAISLLDSAIQNDPSSELLYLRGVIHDMTGNQSLSLQDLDKAVQLDPQNSQALYSLAIVNLQADRFDDGFAAIQKAAHVDPNDFRIVNQYANLLANHPDESKRDLTEASRLAKHGCELTNYEDEICLQTYQAIMQELGDDTGASAVAQTLDDVLDTEDEDMTREIVEHFETITSQNIHEFSLQNIIPDEIPICVQTIEDWNGHHLLFTNGMSARAMIQPNEDRDFRFAELMMLLSTELSFAGVEDPEKSWPWMTLHLLGRCPHNSGQGFSSRPSVYMPNLAMSENQAQTLVDGCEYAAWLLLPNLTPTFGRFQPRYTGREINLITAFPIFREEFDLAQSNSPETLLMKFQELNIPPVVQQNRPNVALA